MGCTDSKPAQKIDQKKGPAKGAGAAPVKAARAPPKGLPADKQKEFKAAQNEVIEAVKECFQELKSSGGNFKIPDGPLDPQVLLAMFQNPSKMLSDMGAPKEVNDSFAKAGAGESPHESMATALLEKIVKNPKVQEKTNKMVKVFTGSKAEVGEEDAKSLYGEQVFSFVSTYQEQIVEFVKGIVAKGTEQAQPQIDTAMEQARGPVSEQIDAGIEQAPDDDVKEALRPKKDEILDEIIGKHAEKVKGLPDMVAKDLNGSVSKSSGAVMSELQSATFAPWWEKISGGKAAVTPDTLSKGLTSGLDGDTLKSMRSAIDVEKLKNAHGSILTTLEELPKKLFKEAMPDPEGMSNTVKEVMPKKIKDASAEVLKKKAGGGGMPGGIGGF